VRSFSGFTTDRTYWTTPSAVSSAKTPTIRPATLAGPTFDEWLDSAS
jgi:hypothetical protein